MYSPAKHRRRQLPASRQVRRRQPQHGAGPRLPGQALYHRKRCCRWELRLRHGCGARESVRGRLAAGRLRRQRRGVSQQGADPRSGVGSLPCTSSTEGYHPKQ
jgi:hypothetical protein